ncbi:MAG: L,D-transpeptidase family protein [Armatimonadota bacterium]
MKQRLVIVVIAAITIIAGIIYIMKADRPLPPNTVVDEILVQKSRRRLIAMRDGKQIKVYRISLGSNPVGHKTQEGDGKTPEGRYTIDYRNPKSKYHLALHISYPNKADKAQAKNRRVSPGGDIMIHGLPNGLGEIGGFQRYADWTQGCIAVTDEEIDELWRAVPNGTPIEIRP